MILIRKLEVFSVLILSLFSFYYTNKIVEFLAYKDPLMQQIKENSKELEILAFDALVSGDYITPGVNGLEVDYMKNFKKMKSYGKYNEMLLVFKEIRPVISFYDYYDKFISSGNLTSSSVSLVFTVRENDDYMEVLNILDETKVVGTFFFDGEVLDRDYDNIKEIVASNHEVELLSYNNSYEKLLFKAGLEKLKISFALKPKYCYATYDNREVLNLCSGLKLHTIIPTIKVSDNIYSNLKGKIRNGSIIDIDISKSNLESLKTVINYIRQRGFNLVSLDELLSEENNLK